MLMIPKWKWNEGLVSHLMTMRDDGLFINTPPPPPESMQPFANIAGTHKQQSVATAWSRPPVVPKEMGGTILHFIGNACLASCKIVRHINETYYSRRQANANIHLSFYVAVLPTVLLARKFMLIHCLFSLMATPFCHHHTAKEANHSLESTRVKKMLCRYVCVLY